MATMTRSEIITEALARAGRKGQTALSLTDAFNFILNKMTKEYPLLRNISHPFTTVANQRWVSLPSDYRSWEQCFYDDDELDWLEPEDYFWYLRTQTDTAGTPNEFMIAEDENRLYFRPKPSTAKAGHFYYAAIHPKVEKTLSFTSGGTYEIKRGDTVTGATSAKTMLVNFVKLTDGAWEDGDAIGILLGTPSGTFVSENLNVDSNLNVATISADATTTDNFQHFFGSKFDEVLVEGLTWKCLEKIREKSEAALKRVDFETLLAEYAGVKIKRKVHSTYRGF